MPPKYSTEPDKAAVTDYWNMQGVRINTTFKARLYLI